MNVIHYSRLSDAIQFYTNLGYKYVEVPWAVPEWAIKATCPNPLSKPAIARSQFLVGSAEQSFIYLDVSEQLGKGRFVACTPCVRPGDIGPFNQPTFMKVELYRNDEVSPLTLNEMMGHAGYYFEKQARRHSPSAQLEWSNFLDDGVPTFDDVLDINLNGLEVGSYGMREFRAIQWVFGTGLAEPRFSMALENRRV